MRRVYPSAMGRARIDGSTSIIRRDTPPMAQRYLNASISRVGSNVYLEVHRSVTLDTAPRSIGCTYYEASLKEVLRLLVNSVGAVEHVRCATRGEGTCSWRAEWKPISSSRE